MAGRNAATTTAVAATRGNGPNSMAKRSFSPNSRSDVATRAKMVVTARKANSAAWARSVRRRRQARTGAPGTASA